MYVYDGCVKSAGRVVVGSINGEDRAFKALSCPSPV